MDEKKKRPIKEIADDMFGISFDNKIKEALAGIELGNFVNSDNKETKKAIKYIEKIRRK